MIAGISGMTVVAGVAGSPVSHSLSPAIHNAWLAAAGIDAVYVAFAPPADGFARFAEGLRGGAVRGLNITAPFKEAALASADRISDRARRAGAAIRPSPSVLSAPIDPSASKISRLAA